MFMEVCAIVYADISGGRLALSV